MAYVFYGIIQFSTVLGINISSWWIASLIARSDQSLAQMGVFAVANQFRGLASVVPGLFTQVGYSLLTDESGENYGGPSRVMLANTFIVTFLVTIVAGLAMIFAHWILPLAYGQAYVAGEGTVLILLATTIIHMSGTPAAHRLSIVGVRATGIINAVWAIIIVLLGILLVPKSGATGASLAFLIAHIFSSVAVIVYLSRLYELPSGYLTMSAVSILGALAIVAIGFFRALSVPYISILTVVMLIVWALFLLVLSYVGTKLGCLPRQVHEWLHSIKLILPTKYK